MQITYAVVALVLGAGVGYFLRRYQAQSQSNSLEQESKRKIDAAEAKAKEVVLSAQEKAANILAELKNEERDRKKQIDAHESRLMERQESVG